MDISGGGIIGLVIALATLIVATITYLRANPKRVLEYGHKVVPLVMARNTVRKRLTVIFDGEELANPHIIEIILRSDGRSDIGVENFSGGQELVLDIGVPATPLASDVDNLAFEMHETKLHVRPNVIKRSNAPLRIELICGAKPKPLKVIHDPLVGVVLREIRKGATDWRYGWKARRWDRAIQWIARLGLAVILVYVTAGLIGLL